MTLAKRNFEVLRELRAAVDDFLRIGAGAWVKPLHCGGQNGSDHSYRLTKLAKTNLADRKKYYGLGG